MSLKGHDRHLWKSTLGLAQNSALKKKLMTQWLRVLVNKYFRRRRRYAPNQKSPHYLALTSILHISLCKTKEVVLSLI